MRAIRSVMLVITSFALLSIVHAVHRKDEEEDDYDSELSGSLTRGTLVHEVYQTSSFALYILVYAMAVSLAQALLPRLRDRVSN